MPVLGRSHKRPWRRCSACGDVCHWHDEAWVCDGPDGCGSEWYPDHAPKFAAPSEDADDGPTIDRAEIETWMTAYVDRIDAGDMTTDHDLSRMAAIADLRKWLDSRSITRTMETP